MGPQTPLQLWPIPLMSSTPQIVQRTLAAGERPPDPSKFCRPSRHTAPRLGSGSSVSPHAGVEQGWHEDLRSIVALYSLQVSLRRPTASHSGRKPHIPDHHALLVAHVWSTTREHDRPNSWTTSAGVDGFTYMQERTSELHDATMLLTCPRLHACISAWWHRATEMPDESSSTVFVRLGCC